MPRPAVSFTSNTWPWPALGCVTQSRKPEHVCAASAGAGHTIATATTATADSSAMRSLWARNDRVAGSNPSVGFPSSCILFARPQPTRGRVRADHHDGAPGASPINRAKGPYFYHGSDRSVHPIEYRIDVDDLAEPGRNKDTFRIRTASGYDVGCVLVGGNIQIHK
jgi:hypothetical protein